MLRRDNSRPGLSMPEASNLLDQRRGESPILRSTNRLHQYAVVRASDEIGRNHLVPVNKIKITD